MFSMIWDVHTFKYNTKLTNTIKMEVAVTRQHWPKAKMCFCHYPSFGETMLSR